MLAAIVKPTVWLPFACEFRTSEGGRQVYHLRGMRPLFAWISPNHGMPDRTKPGQSDVPDILPLSYLL